MNASLVLLLAAMAPTTVGCTPAHAPAVAPVVLEGVDGTRVALGDVVGSHPFTVVTFFSAHCPCQRTHDARLRELIARSESLGVAVLVVDSEESSTAARDAAQARERGYRILLDDQGALARSLDAEYATYSVLLDHEGRVLYRGGFDSDKSHLRENRATYLADAIDDALAHRPLRKAEAKTLGCTLQVR